MWMHLNGSLMLQNTHIKKWLDGNPAIDNADMIERDRARRGQREDRCYAEDVDRMNNVQRDRIKADAVWSSSTFPTHLPFAF